MNVTPDTIANAIETAPAGALLSLSLLQNCLGGG